MKIYGDMEVSFHVFLTLTIVLVVWAANAVDVLYL
jgi:hypothetical protein